MASKAFIVNGVKFVTNNYAAILERTWVDDAFHIMQDLLGVSEVEFAQTNPHMVASVQVLEF